MTRSIDQRRVVHLDDITQLGRTPGGRVYLQYRGREYVTTGPDDPSRYQPSPDEIVIEGRSETTIDGKGHSSVVRLRAVPVASGTWAAFTANEEAKRREYQRRTGPRPVDPLRDHPALRGSRERLSGGEIETRLAGPRLVGLDGVFEAASRAGLVMTTVRVDGTPRLRVDAGPTKARLIDAIYSVESLVIGRLSGEPVACSYDDELASTMLNGRIPACARCAS